MTSSIADLKAEIRRQALARRDALDAAFRIEASCRIAEHGEAAIDLDPGSIVAGFWPIRSEVDARPLLAALRTKGARIALPVVIDKTTIVFRQLIQGADLVKTGFGTVGPAEDAQVLDPHLLLVPLSAFDPTGGRMGYGAGFYDRAIEKLRMKGVRPDLVGLAFACQRVDKVPMEPHDQPLELIITEEGVVRSLSSN